MLPKGFAASSSTGWAAEGSHRRTGVLPSLGGVRGLLQASTFPSGKASMWMVTIGRLTGAGPAPPRRGGGGRRGTAPIAAPAATAAGSQRTRKQQNPDAHHVTLHANPFPGYGRKLRHKTVSSEDAAG